MMEERELTLITLQLLFVFLHVVSQYQVFGSHFTSEETEIQGGQRTCLGPTTGAWQEPGDRATYLALFSRP